MKKLAPIQTAAGMLKQIYGDYLSGYEPVGAKEELIKRIKALSKAEQLLHGVDPETGEII